MLGIDIAKISRIRKAIVGKSFKNRFFTPSECAYCDETADPATHYAGAYCAKEALSKALKCGFGHGLMPYDIEVAHEQSGAPYIVVNEKLASLLNGREIQLSVSHDGDYAVAAVVLVGSGGSL